MQLVTETLDRGEHDRLVSWPVDARKAASDQSDIGCYACSPLSRHDRDLYAKLAIRHEPLGARQGTRDTETRVAPETVDTDTLVAVLPLGQGILSY